MVFFVGVDVNNSGVDVEIVAATRPDNEQDGDLRAGELLESRVTGYDGNVQELRYEWIVNENNAQGKN